MKLSVRFSILRFISPVVIISDVRDPILLDPKSSTCRLYISKRYAGSSMLLPLKFKSSSDYKMKYEIIIICVLHHRMSPHYSTGSVGVVYC